MSEEHQHHLFHHKKEEVSADAEQTTAGYGGEKEYEKAKKEGKNHKHLEQGGKLGTAAAGGFALYEKHPAKKDPQHAHRHKIKEEIATAVAVGGGGVAFHEHHEKKEDKKKEKSHDKKHHHLF